jgi:hypothetical protein
MCKFLLSLFSKKPVPEQNPVQAEPTITKPKEEKVPEAKKPWNFTADEILKKSGIKYADLPQSDKENLDKLVEVVNKLGTMVPDNLKGPRKCNSGYRSSADQFRIYKDRAKKKQAPFTDGVYVESKVPRTAHMTGEAIDINDPNGDLDNWLMDTAEGKQAVKELDLYIEHKDYTAGWCHVQIRKTKSGNRYFIPY